MTRFLRGFRPAFICALLLSGILPFAADPSRAAGAAAPVTNVDFSFEGPFGAFDRRQLRRGFQVYQEVCAACHSLRHVTFRALGEEGGPEFSAEQIKAIAEGFDVPDEEGEPGDWRPGKPFDRFPPVEASDNPPDLSLIVKARAAFHDGIGVTQLVKGSGGPEYIYSFLLGFTGKEREEAGTILYENPLFSGGWVAMAPQLEDGMVEYPDGTDASPARMAEDVTAFLMWAAEPKMHARKAAGLRNFAYMALFALLMFFANRKLWRSVKGKG